MTQAAVDLLLNGDGDLHQKPPPRKRKYTEDYAGSSQDDEDPSWQPGEARTKKRRHHRQRDLRAHRALDAAPSDNNGTPFHPSSTVRCSSYSNPSSSRVSVELTEDCDLAWEDFRQLGTEMIICKEGRFVFINFFTLCFFNNIFPIQENVSISGGYDQWAGARQHLLSFN